MFSEVEEDWNWHLYAGDMIGFAEKVLAYTSEMDKAAFVADSLVYDATLRNMELIGEAATHIPNEIRNKYREIQWRSIVAMRNRLAQDYLGLDDDVIRDIRAPLKIRGARAAQGCAASNCNHVSD